METKIEARIRIGNRVRELRTARGMSQAQLAKAIGKTSRDTISKIENGKNGIAVTTMTDIARVLDVDPVTIVAVTDPDPAAEFAPYLRTAKSYQLDAIRDLLGMRKGRG